MKAIQNVQVWKNGEEKQANAINVILINDDLATNASFYYQLISSSEENQSENLADGNVSCGGQDYIDWDNSNEAAYEFVASKLNLILVD